METITPMNVVFPAIVFAVAFFLGWLTGHLRDKGNAMIKSKQEQERIIHEIRTDIDKLDAFINSVNNPDYDGLPLAGRVGYSAIRWLPLSKCPLFHRSQSNICPMR